MIKVSYNKEKSRYEFVYDSLGLQGAWYMTEENLNEPDYVVSSLNNMFILAFKHE